MNDPRQRAPFPHQSSSLDLRSTYANATPHGTPPPPRWTEPSKGGAHLLPHHPHHSLSNGSARTGGPGFFPPQPDAGPSRSFVSAARGAGHLLGLRMERKPSDTDIDLDDSAPFGRRSSAGGITMPSSLSSLGAMLPLDSERIARLQRSLPSAATVRFLLLCTLWYASSAVSSNTGKVILNAFRFPVTLTIVQFAFVAGLCWVCSRPQLGWTGRLRTPTKAILRHTLPMAAFQVGGHIFSSLAISRVPVSTVHTIKAMSPLFTVAAYALLFRVSYSPATYFSLLPLTFGVMLAVSADFTLSNYLGLVCAFGSTIVFVSQNIFFKKVMPTPGSAADSSAYGPRLDKINLLYFSSGMAFLLMIPIWIYSDVPRLLALWFSPVAAAASTTATSTSMSRVIVYFFINGTVHFGQNVLAFNILANTSPVTYSIASLVKRIAVICLAIVWFKQSVHGVQAVGIGLTALGLWMYNNAKRDVDKGEKRVRAIEAARDGMLPSNIKEQRMLDGTSTPDSGDDEKYTPYNLTIGRDFKAHVSPKPNYPAHFESTSTSSALPSPFHMTNGHASGLSSGLSSSIPSALGNGMPHSLANGPPMAMANGQTSPPYDNGQAYTFAPPPPPPARKGVQPGPYPSPPASTASSPPLPAVQLRDDIPTVLTAGA